MQEGIQLPELLAKIKALREAELMAEHVAFSFMKRKVHPLIARDTLSYQYTARATRRGCPAGRLMMTTSSTGWAGSLRTCRRTCPARCPSTPSLFRRMRSVAALNVRVLIM
jgi:hypothetical protein